MFSLLHDVRYAIRGLLRHRGMTAVAILTLAVGVAAATTVFTVVNGVLLRPLPYRDAHRLVNVWNDFGEGAQNLPAVTANHWRAYQEMSTTFEGFAAATGPRDLRATGIVTDPGHIVEPERVPLAGVSANFFPLLGVTPMIGRQFTTADEAVNGPKVVMISHRLWLRRFNGDSSIVGKTIHVDDTPQQVIGVLPASFRLLLPAETYSLRDSDVWRPLQIDWADNSRFRDYTIFTVFGRLKDGVTIQAAGVEMDAIAARLRVEDAANSTNLRIRLVPLHDDVVKTVRPGLMTLLAAVSLLVLIACANVANILLTRATTREREITIRLAVGASRWRLARQLLIESSVLTLAAAAIGIAAAVAALSYLGYIQPSSLPRVSDVGLDWRVLLFVSGLLILIAFLCGTMPALHSARQDLVSALRGARAANQGRQVSVRDALIVGEVALSVVLLVAASLLVQSFSRLERVEPGYVAENALTFEISLPASAFPRFEQRQPFTMELIRRLRALPGVTAVGATSELPLTGQGVTMNYGYDAATVEQWGKLNAERIMVTSDYLEAAGMTLLEGRTLNEFDSYAAPVVMIDQLIARVAWPNESAIGKQLTVFPPGAPNRTATVVGVVAHARTADLRIDGLPQVYFSYHWSSPATMKFVVRSNENPANLAQVVRKTVSELNSTIPVNNVRPFAYYLGEALAPAQFTALLMQIVGVLALFLAAVGLYAVIAFAVGQRTREFGIRIALGETPGSLRRSVLGRGIRLVAISTVIGIVVAAAGGTFAQSLLYETDPHDLLTFSSVAVFLLFVSAMACYVPARRASRVDPLEALRAE